MLMKNIVKILAVLVASALLTSTVLAGTVIEWQPDTFDIKQPEGSTTSYTVEVTFSRYATDVVPRLTPSLDQWISVTPSEIAEVNAGDTIEIHLESSAPVGSEGESTGGVLQLREGSKGKNMAKPLHISFLVVEGQSDGLPPDPGPEGELTLEGIDADGDGVRDDIQRYIAITYPNDPNLQTALTHVFSGFDQTLRPSVPSVEEALQITSEIDRAEYCVIYLTNADGFIEVLGHLKARILNTLDRTNAYLEYDAQLDGQVFTVPNVSISGYAEFCDFELQ